MKLTQKVYETKAEKDQDFWAGVRLFFFVNAILIALGLVMFSIGIVVVKPIYPSESARLVKVIETAIGLLALPANIGTLIYTAFTRRWVALGFLSVLGALLFVVVCSWVFIANVCFNLRPG